MIIDVEGREETRGQVTDEERAARYGHRSAVVIVDDAEAALLLERELFDRGALAVIAGTSNLDLVRAAGMIAIVTSDAGVGVAGVIDARRVAATDAVVLLERRGVLFGATPGNEQLTQGEGI